MIWRPKYLDGFYAKKKSLYMGQNPQLRSVNIICDSQLNKIKNTLLKKYKVSKINAFEKRCLYKICVYAIYISTK